MNWICTKKPKKAQGPDEEITTSSQDLLKSSASSEMSFYSTTNGEDCEFLVRLREATEETPGKSYKLNQLCNKISILSESSFIIETKSNLEKATASLPAETKTYPNTKEDKGLD